MLIFTKLRLGTAIVAMLLVSACDTGGFMVNAEFSNTRDIAPGTPVLFENQVIGEVSDVELLDQGARVQLRLDENAANAISSTAAVVVNRLKQGAPLEIYNRTSADSAKLQNGQAVKGLDSMFQLGAWMLGDALQVGAGTVSEYVESFQDYLQSDQFQQDKKQVQEQLSTAKKAAESAFEDVESHLEAASKELQSSEQAAAKAAEQLGEELAPVVEELARSGVQLAEQLQKFTAGLAQSAPEQRQAGEQFLDSLLQMLEKFNQGFERGSQPTGQQEQQKEQQQD